MGQITKFVLFAILKVRAENLKKEKDILKMSDVRLTQQRESLLVEQRGQNLLLTNLRTIQVWNVTHGKYLSVFGKCQLKLTS